MRALSLDPAHYLSPCASGIVSLIRRRGSCLAPYTLEGSHTRTYQSHLSGRQKKPHRIMSEEKKRFVRRLAKAFGTCTEQSRQYGLCLQRYLEDVCTKRMWNGPSIQDYRERDQVLRP